MNRTVNYGHRGAMSIAPENTLASVRAAQDAGATGVEFDVQFSRDEQLVVIHDHTLERTTNGQGRVADFTLAELKQLDAGTPFDARFAGERIPTLQEIFDLSGRPLKFNVEIKFARRVAEDTGLERAIIECIRHNRMEARVLLSSFNLHSLRRVRQLAPDLRLGVLYHEPLDENEISDLRPEALHPYWQMVDESLVQQAHKRNQQVNVWTVDAAEDMRKMMSLGVDIIMTNYPQRLAPLLAI